MQEGKLSLQGAAGGEKSILKVHLSCLYQTPLKGQKYLTSII